jgi:sodium-dependent dicarboxylate transporter 2/3/5
MLWILVWWITECVPLGIAALLAPLVFCVTGIMTWRTSLTSFTDPIIWIFMAGFVLAAAFRKWDLDRRVAVRLGSMYKGNNPMVAALFVAALPVFILTLTGSITASTSVVKVLAGHEPGLEPLSEDLSRLMPEAMPAVLIIFLAGLIRLKGEPLLKWDEKARGIDWNVVFLFGGGISLGLGLQASGFAEWLATSVGAALGDSSSAWTVFAVSCVLGFALTYAASNTAAALISCPIAASLAMGAGVAVAPPIIGAALACSISSAIPSTTPPMAIVYSSGFVKIWSMFKVGIVSDLLRLAALILIGPFLAGLLY